jgi:hypothetical protein
MNANKETPGAWVVALFMESGQTEEERQKALAIFRAELEPWYGRV